MAQQNVREGQIEEFSASPPTEINHQSHPHQLLLLETPDYPTGRFRCSRCSSTGDGWGYHCFHCEFDLHVLCAEPPPPQINDPSHHNHSLLLLETPDYPSGQFTCNRCGSTGDGWGYHCFPCEFDLHVLCAEPPPPQIDDPSHLNHSLLLLETPDYPSGQFTCNRCGSTGDGWGYHCFPCEFDLHVHCAALPPAQINHPSHPNHSLISLSHRPHPQSHANHSGGIQHLNQSNWHNGVTGNALASAALYGFGNGFGNGIGNGIGNALANAFASGDTQNITGGDTQNITGDFTGGNGGDTQNVTGDFTGGNSGDTQNITVD